MILTKKEISSILGNNSKEVRDLALFGFNLAERLCVYIYMFVL